MALNMQVQTTPGGSWSNVDLSASQLGNFKLSIADSHPARLEFTANQPQQNYPFQLRSTIKFWDDTGTLPDLVTPQSSSLPAFMGHLWEVQPAESNLLRCVCYDCSFIPGNELKVMSAAWQNVDPPTPDATAVPRLVYNVPNYNDPDYAYSRSDDFILGDVFADVLNDIQRPLEYFNASPTAGSAYVSSELLNFDYIPQDKIISTNESVRQFLNRMTQAHYPDWYFLWRPTDQKWHWQNRSSATAVTLTLNDSTASQVVSSMELHRTLDGRYPAISIFGPPDTTVEEFSTLDGSLTILDVPGTLVETYSDPNGSHEIRAYRQFQITDTTKRRGARLLPSLIFVRENDYFWVQSKSPCFQVSFDAGETWQGLESVYFNFQTGSVEIVSGLYPAYYIDPLPEGAYHHWWIPNAFKLIWAPYGTPIIVRYPSTGWAGTSNSVAGQETQEMIYDETLAVGYNRFGNPVTTATRVAQFTLLAAARHAATKDILYTGGCMLEGIQWEYLWLARKCNLAAIDEDGAPLTTGWESTDLIISDVEYDFEQRTTTLSFSSQVLAGLGDNIDLMKERLKIGPVQAFTVYQTQYIYGNTIPLTYNFRGKPSYQGLSQIVQTETDLYYDKATGTIEEAL